jgi:DNA-directed RNA polymerase specialized sigma24 family protein
VLAHSERGTNLATEYKKTDEPSKKADLRGRLVHAYRRRIASIVRVMVANPAHWEDAKQAATVGLLEALDRFARGEVEVRNFDVWIGNQIAPAIRACLDTHVRWRKAPNRGRSPARVAAREAAAVHMYPAPLAEEFVPGEGRNPEEQVADAEERALLLAWTESLPREDREVLFSESRSRHHKTLVTAARAAFASGGRHGS